MPPLLGDRLRLREALVTKRAAIAALEAAWVTAAEADALRNTSRDVRIDDRGTLDKATWSRHLAAASVHEPDFKPRIRRLLREIDSVEKLLAMPGLNAHVSLTPQRNVGPKRAASRSAD